MSEWYEGYEYRPLVFEDRQAGIVFPKEIREGRWAIYTEYFGAFPNAAKMLLEKGYCVARFENRSRWGTDEDQAARERFAAMLEREYGLAHKCVPIGMSCGGLHAVRFAAHCPDRVAALYLDAPVINLLSCPLHYGDGERDEGMAQECLKALNKTETEMLSYRKHALDDIPALVKAKIPVVMVYGGSDPVVPYHENGLLLEQAYRAAGLPIRLFGKPECAHHPHGLSDPTPIVEAIMRFDGSIKEEKTEGE